METMAIKKVLITGSAGYIGSVLAPVLESKDYHVIGLDTLFFKNALLNKKRAHRLFKKDIRKISIKDLEGIDAIIHLAALSNDAMGEIKKEITRDINHNATVRLAKMAKKAGVKRFIFSSSCSIYGISKKGVVNEESFPNPLTAYAKSKILSEKALQKLADKNFTVALLRNATVYGFSPCFRDDLVVNNLTACGMTLGEIRIKSDGTPWRPLIDVRDLSKIMMLFLEIPSQKINGKIINIGKNENNFQIRKILELIHKQLPACKIIYTGEHGADTRSYQVNFDKFQALFPQFKLNWDLEKSIADLIDNLKKNNYTKRHFLTGKYTRLVTLNKMLKKGNLTDTLFWQNER